MSISYSKLSQLVNIKLLCKYSKGFENFKTKFGTEPFMVGRLVKKEGTPFDEGNFEAAIPVKGTKRADWEWKTAPFNKERWTNSFAWTFSEGETEHKVDLTWKQNKNLMEKLPVGVPEGGLIITPRIADKTIDFEVEQPLTEEDVKTAGTPEAKQEVAEEVAPKNEEEVDLDIPF